MSSENLKFFSQLWKIREKNEKVSPNFNVSLSIFFPFLLFACLMVIYYILVSLGNGERKIKFKNYFITY